MVFLQTVKCTRTHRVIAITAVTPARARKREGNGFPAAMAEAIVMKKLATLLIAVIVATVHCQPQYRVFVHPPFMGSSPFDTFTLCFSEHDAASPSANNCPLGRFERRANGPGEPLQELALGDGSDAIPPAYPIEIGPNSETEFLGVGLYLLISGTNSASHWFPRIGGAPGTETTETTTSSSIVGGYTFTITFRVYCVPEFTGLDCNTPVNNNNNNNNNLPTTQPPTTIPPTTTPPATVSTTLESTQGKTTDSSGAPSFGLGLGLGIGIAVVVAVIALVAIIILCLLQRRGPKGRDRNNLVDTEAHVYEDSDNFKKSTL